METLHFTYDPLAITRLLLQRYVEEKIEGKFYKAKQFACYEYLRELTDEELENNIEQYAVKNDVKEITFSDWIKECELIFEVIFSSKRYKDLELKFKLSGHGETGLGVLDKSDNTFYDCAMTAHWDTVRKIVQEKHNNYHEYLEHFWMFDKSDEFNGVSREEIDLFIVNNFEFIGGQKRIEEYI